MNAKKKSEGKEAGTTSSVATGLSATQAAARTAAQRKSREGVVVSNKMDKTVVVEVERLVKHSQYGKYVRQTKRFYAHDEVNRCKVGDRVAILESRPFSKLKRWRVDQVVVAAEAVE